MKIASLIGSLWFVLACQTHTQLVVEEPTKPPLPPASGTPIGLWIDESARLQLRQDQLDRLHELDRELEVRLDENDSEMRELDRPPGPPPGAAGGGPGGGRGGGGMGGGGMGGPMGGGGMGGPAGGGRMGGGGGGMGGGGMSGGGMGGPMGGGGGGPPGGDQAPMPKAPPDPAELEKRNARRAGLAEEREALVHGALARALDVLDPDQRPVAEQILDERGAGAPPPGRPGPGQRPPPGGMRRPGGLPRGAPRSLDTPTPVERP